MAFKIFLDWFDLRSDLPEGIVAEELPEGIATAARGSLPEPVIEGDNHQMEQPLTEGDDDASAEDDDGLTLVPGYDGFFLAESRDVLAKRYWNIFSIRWLAFGYCVAIHFMALIPFALPSVHKWIERPLLLGLIFLASACLQIKMIKRVNYNAKFHRDQAQLCLQDQFQNARDYADFPIGFPLKKRKCCMKVKPKYSKLLVGALDSIFLPSVAFTICSIRERWTPQLQMEMANLTYSSSIGIPDVLTSIFAIYWSLDIVGMIYWLTKGDVSLSMILDAAGLSGVSGTIRDSYGIFNSYRPPAAIKCFIVGIPMLEFNLLAWSIVANHGSWRDLFTCAFTICSGFKDYGSQVLAVYASLNSFFKKDGPTASCLMHWEAGQFTFMLVNLHVQFGLLAAVFMVMPQFFGAFICPSHLLLVSGCALWNSTA